MFAQKLQNAKHLKEIELCDNDVNTYVATEALAIIAILHWNLLESIKLRNSKLDEQNMLLLELLLADFKCESIVFSNMHALQYVCSLNDGKKALHFIKRL